MNPTTPEPPDFAPALTPVERRGSYWLKRDDLFRVAGVRGGKVRTCWYLSGGARGLITASHRVSPQVNFVAQIARRRGVPCRVHTPTGPYTPEMDAARDAGAEIIQHTSGYNGVIIKRARDDAKERPGWADIPFGMECDEAVTQTRKQAENIPREAQRLVVPVGSGMSLAGILHGLRDFAINIPVLGVSVGSDPLRRLAKYAPPDWEDSCTIVPAKVDYHREQHESIEDVALDPVYEAKCCPFLKPGDILWLIGVRQTVGG